ncbi:tRNA (guanine46-N7-)-methyltransferase [Lachnospiraceae bacterium TWA4]|nr:tRNA (guanine46-N7-)-methyltransferase [Lachnospiraceae bacterium TWA4]
MRLRNVPGSRDTIAKSHYCFDTPTNLKGHWKDFFKNTNPIHIEVGMGKGRFITSLAQNNPTINYIGIEKYSSVLVRALEKQEELLLPNLCFIRMDAEDINDVFGEDEISRIYLNFSDPWPKDRHAKRRLTSVQFMNRYEKLLTPTGRLEFKTDNRPLFDFSLESIPEANWDLTTYTFDLHHNEELMVGNIMTEYEERFSREGNPICKLIALPPKKTYNNKKGNFYLEIHFLLY